MARQRKLKPRTWRKSEMSLWHEAANPLRGLTLARAMMIYDYARRGNYAELHWLYNEIEAADPTLMVCRERREAALVELDWTVVKKRAGRLGNRWDDKLAGEQQAFLEEAYGACDDFEAACEHLMGGFFRGFAHSRPIYSDRGRALLGFENLDGWNFVRNRETGAWHWNPDAASAHTAANLPEIPATELVSLVRSRHIDYPAFSIYIRAALGEQQWGVFIERYGVPPVMVIMPEFADKAEEQTYLSAAEKLCEGGSGALPHGSQATYAGESRGTDPFSGFLKHQQELIVLLSTGGLLTSLTGATGIGQGASEEHGKTWATIVRRDARMVAAALEARVSYDLLNAAYPGGPHLVEFGFETEAEPTADAVFETATKARAAGYRIAQADLEEKTGYNLIEEQSETHETTPFSRFGGTVFNKATATPLQNAANPLQNRAQEDYVARGAAKESAVEGLLEALQAEQRKLADELAKIAKLPAEEQQAAARQMLQELELYRDDEPRLQEAIERLLAEGFVAGLSPVANRGADRESDGKFATKGTGDRTVPGGYTAEHEKQVGKKGDWKSLGLPAGRDVPADPPTPKTGIAEARSRLEQGESVKTPLGDTLAFDETTRKHLYREKGSKPRKQEEINQRLQALDQARAAIEKPHEIWRDQATGRNIYVRFEMQARGREVINAVDTDKTHVYSWHTNETSFDHWRKGRLLYVRK